jgi:hypothetical protein
VPDWLISLLLSIACLIAPSMAIALLWLVAESDIFPRDDD